MTTAAQIRERLNTFLAGDLSQDEFEDWFAVYSWNVHGTRDHNTEELVGAVELAFAEYSNGHFSDDDLRRELASLATDPSVAREIV